MFKYGTFKFDDNGIKKRLRWKHAILWDEVVSVYTILINKRFGRYYETSLKSIDRKDLVIKCSKGNLVEYSEVLNFILRKVPEDIVSEKTRFVAKWGPEIGEINERERLLKQWPHDPGLQKSLAKLYWVQFDFKKARKLFEHALKINPNDTEALEAIALIDRDQNIKMDKIIAQYDHILEIEPNNDQYLRSIATLCLNADDGRGEIYAKRLLKLRPHEMAIRMGLGSYYFRKESFEEAKAIFRELVIVSSRNVLREFSRKEISSIEKYQLDQRVRKGEEATKRRGDPPYGRR
jgi:tetratricopeptide (TPR) repeat protein